MFHIWKRIWTFSQTKWRNLRIRKLEEMFDERKKCLKFDKSRNVEKRESHEQLRKEEETKKPGVGGRKKWKVINGALSNWIGRPRDLSTHIKSLIRRRHGWRRGDREMACVAHYDERKCNNIGNLIIVV